MCVVQVPQHAGTTWVVQVPRNHNIGKEGVHSDEVTGPMLPVRRIAASIRRSPPCKLQCGNCTVYECTYSLAVQVYSNESVAFFIAPHTVPAYDVYAVCLHLSELHAVGSASTSLTMSLPKLVRQHLPSARHMQLTCVC